MPKFKIIQEQEVEIEADSPSEALKRGKGLRVVSIQLPNGTWQKLERTAWGWRDLEE